jgi:hypothetical protein
LLFNLYLGGYSKMENNDESKNRTDQIYESLKDLDGLKLSQKKGLIVQDLQKVQKQLSEVDLTKGKEREKFVKIFNGKATDLLLSIEVVEKLLKEKDF